MTESGPRKSLWELMGHKSPEEVPSASTEPATSALPADQSAASAASSGAPAANPAKGKGLWALMQHSEEIDAATISILSDAPRSAIEAPVNPQDERLQRPPETHGDLDLDAEPADQVPARRVDRRLRQTGEPEVEIVDEPDENGKGLTRQKIDKRLRQLEEPDVEIVDDPPADIGTDDEFLAHRSAGREPLIRSTIRGIPTPFAATPREIVSDEVIAGIPLDTGLQISFDRVGRSQTALWSFILGTVSLPISLIAIYPAIWSRVPASLSGFAALLLGFLAQGELARAGRKGRELIMANAGMLAGLLAMFSGPLIYAPLDLYGRLSNFYTGGHLRQIGRATDTYLQQQHSFPAGGLFKEVPGGQDLVPLHGWMTLLLPQLADGAGLARQIDLSKPYFDPANLPVMSQTISAYLAAGGSLELNQGKFGVAHFAGVGGLVSLSDGSVAHAGIFDVNSATNRDDVIDGLSNTMIVGEVSTSYPAWGEPHNWRQLGKGLNREPQGFGNARHTGGMFLMADGSVRFLPNNTEPKVLNALSTRDGEDVP